MKRENSNWVKRATLVLSGTLLFLVGFLLVLNSFSGITGLAIDETADTKGSGILGLILTFFGIFLLKKARQREVKGQAAMEFLMTYGWALLAMIIALGVFIYLGAFSLRPDTQINLSPPFVGDGAVVPYDRVFSFEVKTVRDLTILGVSVTGSSICSEEEIQFDIKLQSGESKIIDMPCSDLVEGQSFKADITIRYKLPGSSLEQIARGTVRS